MMDDPLAYHVTFSTHGFWLPNDPRGSCSTEIRGVHLRKSHAGAPLRGRRAVGPATIRDAGATPKAVTDRTAMGDGVTTAAASGPIESSGRVDAEAMVSAPAPSALLQPIMQVGRLLRQAATQQLLKDGLHPFAGRRNAGNYLPSVWAQDFWKTFLYTEDDILRAIAYVQENPVKEGKRAQRWWLVTPFPSDGKKKADESDG